MVKLALVELDIFDVEGVEGAKDHGIRHGDSVVG